MEEIREVALAYYANGSSECKEMFEKFFETMDTDRNKRISIIEFRSYMSKNCPGMFKPGLFNELDQDGNGYLDFKEVITFCYMVTMRSRFCDCCGEFLKNVYFTCAWCFLNNGNDQSFDVCLKCYKNKKLGHEHQLFLDNYVMLNILQSNSRRKAFENALTTAMLKADADLANALYMEYQSDNAFVYEDDTMGSTKLLADEHLYSFYDMGPSITEETYKPYAMQSSTTFQSYKPTEVASSSTQHINYQNDTSGSEANSQNQINSGQTSTQKPGWEDKFKTFLVGVQTLDFAVNVGSLLTQCAIM